MKLDPIVVNPDPKPKDEKSTEEKLKEQVLDLQRVCNLLMTNQS
ncbi:hypothetical protein [Bacillus atrophaeus]|nr:hypothetical protein [Bacillus atrophaeus]MEC0765100.1 hypothetical protein [Bacillus atrophaeus]MEC0778229.1 hypothetical protein [Bacillus atrophaeus]MEC0808265.1 hypothetical protein [Bacillus atrophaeus]